MPNTTSQNSTLMAMDEVRRRTNPAFRYVISINQEAIAAFTECTLPTIEWEMEPVKEGGLNNYVHQLPGRQKETTITLKNGVGLGTALMDWYMDALKGQFQRARKQVSITFMSGPNRPSMAWTIENCIPKRWTGPQLKSDDNTIAIQTLELACGEVDISMVSGAALPPPPPPKPWVPKAPRAKDPKNKGLIANRPPRSPRATSPKNKALIPVAPVSPAKRRKQTGGS